MMNRICVAALGLIAFSAHADADVSDQFFRFTELNNRAVEANLPNEVVDPFTGTLRIVHEDLSFPGKGGLRLRILRTYSSKVWGRTDVLSQDSFLADKEPSVVGLGWSFHMGRIRNPNATGATGCASANVPIFEMADGTARAFYRVNTSSQEWRSRDFWKLEMNCSVAGGTGICVRSTDGTKYEFSSAGQYFVGVPPVWPLSRIVDIHGNTITISNANGRVTQAIDTYNRVVAFNYANCFVGSPHQCLQSVVATGSAGGTRAINYSYDIFTAGQLTPPTANKYPLQSPGRAFLKTVKPTLGPGFTYDYYFDVVVSQNQYALKSTSNPYGGTTTFEYASRNFFTGRDLVPMPVVTSKTTSGRELPTSTWQYAYDSPQTGMQTATVTRPDLLQDKYEFYGFGYVKDQNSSGSVWRVGLQRKHESAISGGVAAKTETLEWSQGPLVASTPFPAPDYGSGAACANWTYDNSVNAPLLTKRTIDLDGSRYVTEFSMHDTYGQPRSVVETGEAQRSGSKPIRTTTLAYSPASTANVDNRVLGRVSSEQTCVSGECSLTTRTFNAPRELMDSETVRTVATGFTWDTEGNLSTVTNAVGKTLTLSGYTAGFGIATNAQFGTPGSSGAFSIAREAYWDGQLKSETSARGFKTSFTYDANGRIETVTPPFLPPTGPVTTGDIVTYTYDNLGGTYYSVRRGATSAPNVLIETFALDGLGRVIEHSNNLAERRTTEFDGMGRVAFQSIPFTGAAASNEFGTRTTFDGLGRPKETKKRILRASTSCAEPGRCKGTFSFLPGHCKSTVLEVKSANDTETTTACFESFGDPNEERLVKVTDAKGEVSNYSYDAIGNFKTFLPPMPGAARSATYFATTFFPKTVTAGGATREVLTTTPLGQPKSSKDARGVTSTFEYADALSRPTNLSFGSGHVENVARSYDGPVLGATGSAHGGSYVYTYDAQDRIRTQAWTFGGQTYTTRYDYDASGCLTGLTYPTGTKLVITCDRKSRPLTITRQLGATNASIASNIAYHPAGRITSLVLGNSNTLGVSFKQGRIDRILAAMPSGTKIVDLTYTLDGVDNVGKITDAVVSANTATFDYDKLNRLLTATSVSTPILELSYDYDKIGNRSFKQLKNGGVVTERTDYTYSPLTGRLTKSNGPSAPPIQTLTFGAMERMSASSDGATYRSDALGRRVAKTDPAGGVDVVYHYDAAGRLIAETLPTGAKVREYYYAGEWLVAIDGCINSFSVACGEREFVHSDILGSIVARTDTAGAVTRRIDYQPWGETAASIPAATTLRFNGRTFDTGTRLLDYGARAYSPELGRFLSPDSVWSAPALPQTANLYSYTLNNPYKYSDPSGHVPFLVVTAGIGSLIGAGIAAYATYDPETGVNWAAVGGGFVAGALVGAGLGAAASTALAGSATASTGAVVKGGALWLAGGGVAGEQAMEREAPAIRELGQQLFSRDGGRSGAIAQNVIVRGSNMRLENFTIGTAAPDGSLQAGGQLLYAMRQILSLAQANGATTITLEGTVINSQLAQGLGLTYGADFSYTIAANQAAFMALFRQALGAGL